MHDVTKFSFFPVTDLKQELKKRNLSMTGSKVTLIERLKPVLEQIVLSGKSVQIGLQPNTVATPTGRLKLTGKPGGLVLRVSGSNMILKKDLPRSVKEPSPSNEGQFS